MPDIKVSGTFKDDYELLNKGLQYVHKLLQDFKSKRLAMVNKDRTFFQYNSGDLVYIISPLHESIAHHFKKGYDKICRTSRYFQNYGSTQLSINDIRWKILRGLFKHERLKLTKIRTNQGNVQNLAQLKLVMNAGLKI